MSKSEVARELGVARQTVATWEQRLAEGGKESLKRGDLGRPRQLDAGQERELGKVLMAGALAAGYPTELWTLPRIGKVITRQFGVEYSTGHLWHLLRRLGFSCQKPEKRAIQRNEPEMIVRWSCLAQKKPSEKTRTIVFIDESGLSERPSVARTWSLRGQTPVLQHSFTWKQLSAIAGLSFSQFYFRFFPGAIRSEPIIEFLGALKRQIKKPLLIIWDGAAIHRSRKVSAWLEELNGHIARWRACQPTPPNSIRLKRSGPISKTRKWPTGARPPSGKSVGSPEIGSNPGRERVASEKRRSSITIRVSRAS